MESFGCVKYIKYRIHRKNQEESLISGAVVLVDLTLFSGISYEDMLTFTEEML